MRKFTALLLAISMIALFGYGCEEDPIVCTDEVGWVSDTINTQLYYPCDISSPTGATTMSAGYTQSLENVEWLSEKVVEAGYVVLAFTPTSNYDLVSGWRDAHEACIEELKSVNATHSVLRGMIDESKLQTCGHSKGGGGSLWAASRLQGTLKTAIGMAPYEEGFFDSTLGSVTAATFVQAGAADTLATTMMTTGEYNGLGTISKMFSLYTGYDHLAWTTSGTASRQDRISGDIIAWMKYYMDGDTSYASTLSNTSGTTSHEWVDESGSGNNSSGGNTGGCN